MNRISVLLKEKGLPQQFIVDHMGVGRSTVSYWCSNTVQPPLEKLYRVAELLGVDIYDLLVPIKKLK